VNQCCVTLVSSLLPLSSTTTYIFLGGSTVPQLVLTEQSVAVLSHLDNTTSASVPQISKAEPVAGPSGEQQCKVSLNLKTKKPLKRKRQAPADSMNIMINLQNRQLQVERERLHVEKEKLKSVQGIHSELAAIRSVLCVACGVTIQSAGTEGADKEE